MKMIEYNGPIGKANVLESFREETEPFIVLDYSDSDFTDKVFEFMTEYGVGHKYSSDFLLRSAGTFEGMLPFYDERFGCYVGRTFAGLMESENCNIYDLTKSRKKFGEIIDYLKNSIASRFFNAGGGSDLERRIFEDSNFEFKIGNDDKNIELLRNYAGSRLVDLREHSMKFILQKRVDLCGELYHVMEHPNFEDLLVVDKEGYGLIDFPVFPKDKSKISEYLNLLNNSNEILNCVEFMNFYNKLFADKYENVTSGLNKDYSYLVEFIKGSYNSKVIPVQATPIFRKNSTDRTLQKSDLQGMRTILAQKYSEDDLDVNFYSNRGYKNNSFKKLDLRGKVLTAAPIHALLSHFHIRIFEGAKGFDKYEEGNAWGNSDSILNYMDLVD